MSYAQALRQGLAQDPATRDKQAPSSPEFVKADGEMKGATEDASMAENIVLRLPSPSRRRKSGRSQNDEAASPKKSRPDEVQTSRPRSLVTKVRRRRSSSEWDIEQQYLVDWTEAAAQQTQTIPMQAKVRNLLPVEPASPEMVPSLPSPVPERKATQTPRTECGAHGLESMLLESSPEPEEALEQPDFAPEAVSRVVKLSRDFARQCWEARRIEAPPPDQEPPAMPSSPECMESTHAPEPEESASLECQVECLRLAALKLSDRIACGLDFAPTAEQGCFNDSTEDEDGRVDHDVSLRIARGPPGLEHPSSSRGSSKATCSTMASENNLLLKECSLKSMDLILRECFLQAASTRVMDWNLPMKGTKLYTQHMRACRRAEWSVNVKESSFRCLGLFLAKLEEEKLLELKEGEPDPVVMRICREHPDLSAWQPWPVEDTAEGRRC